MKNMEFQREGSENKLKIYFYQIMEDKKVEVDISVINSILENELGINLTILNSKLKCIIPYMFVHFIKCWPEWKKLQFFNEQTTLDNRFENFKEYLIFKIKYMIENDFEKAVTMLNTVEQENKLTLKESSSTQTNHKIEKNTAPFSIEVTGPPKILNSLVFCEGAQGAVYVKEYKVTTVWGPPLNLRQLINWPFIEVEFKSDHLHFKRTNKHDFQRYLTHNSEMKIFQNTENFIESIDIIVKNVERKAYTLNTITEYCNTLVTFLRSQEHKTHAESSNTLNEIENVLEDFILDITDIKQNSIATNTTVVFNIGHTIYARNKSINTSDSAICFEESIQPKIALSLFSFTAVNDVTITSFDHLFTDNSRQSLSITYKCTYCNISYTNSTQLWNHLETTHLMEQPVLCFKCEQQFQISNLANNRWFHICNKENLKK